MANRIRLLTAIALLPLHTALAHLPFLERQDYTTEQPARITDIAQSLAYYSWLQNGDDVDVYTFDLLEPTRLKIEFLVPACFSYFRFYPRLAVIGPELPAPTEELAMVLPVTLPPGYGALALFHPEVPVRERPIMYEPFGGKWYFEGPEIDQVISTPGTWYIVVWDDLGNGGDYVMAPGYVEGFKGPEILQALFNTAIIRKNDELHAPCGRRSR